MIKTTISGGSRTVYGYDANADNMLIGSQYTTLLLRGRETRPTYRTRINNNNVDNYLALEPDFSKQDQIVGK
jgi:hypothetical protein